MADIGGMRCEPIRDDSGEIIAVARVSPDISAEARGHLREVVEAARRLAEQELAEDPTLADRQAAGLRRIRERNRRLRRVPTDGVEWRYLPSGRVKHALRRPSNVGAECGLYTLPASAWLGTGSQAEYERVAVLPECQSCVKAMSR